MMAQWDDGRAGVAPWGARSNTMARIIVTPAPTMESVRVYQVRGGRGVDQRTRIQV